MDPHSTADGKCVPTWSYDLVCAERDKLHALLKAACDAMDEAAPLGDTVPRPSLAERIKRMAADRSRLREALKDIDQICAPSQCESSFKTQAIGEVIAAALSPDAEKAAKKGEGE